MSNNILKYESDVWKTADLLRGSGIKESDFPKYMMPFFALLMVESRLVRAAEKLEEDISRDDIDDFVEMFELEGLGYNTYVIKKNKTLKDICKNDKTFDTDFRAYLKAFDPETKSLLGVDKGPQEEKFLDISGVSALLAKKRVLFDYVKTWSEIDLTPFNNSEITTLEEHIKRRWADISAETAGEQYTPDDIIALIAELIVSQIRNDNRFITIYDATCGGGNLLFGVEDKILETYPEKPTATFGQEWNDALFALSKIESRFRKDAQIEYGNTLTEIGKFYDKSFSVAVANPPYGVDWKGFEKDIRNDNTERFVDLPSISDGQFLFTQHILYKLADDGMAVVVHNGSTLFSGDAGSGESNIRKKFFDEDWVEAIIQMPTDEFFNTGIYTYLWVFNKNKADERKDKVILINASELFSTLKKSKGKKRKQMLPENRKDIVDTYLNFKDNDFARVFDKWHFYYNKQNIMLTNIDENGKYIQMPVKINKEGEKVEEKSIKLTPIKITQSIDGHLIEISDFEITDFPKGDYVDKSTGEVRTWQYKSLSQYFEEEIKPLVNSFDYKESNLKVYTTAASYWYDADKETLIEDKNGKQEELGCGKIVIKASLKKDSKTKKPKSISITVELTQDKQKDYEIISYNPNPEINWQNITAFMAKYIFKPFEYIDNTIGVEINFNKVFYKPETLREISEITADLEKLEETLSELEGSLSL
ncbi:MAG: SAM-dependent methyltransferase [Bacteroidales bacterium]|jgi:type I restriction enzyme M protein|nr:SAM-dependent methyltransferase [Bacteroidales bacterium]